MSLSQFLASQAAEIAKTSPEFVAIEMLKQAGLSDTEARLHVAQNQMEKSAAEHLVASGVSAEQATQLVKQAGVTLAEMSFTPELSVEEKAAGILKEASAKVAELEAELEAALEKIAELEMEQPEELQKLASVGKFTKADLEALQQLPVETLTKVATITEEPWSMGKGTGVNKNSVDPLADWLLS